MKALFIIGLWFLVIVLPAICWRVGANLEGRLTQLKKVEGARAATFIVLGMFETPPEDWEEYAWHAWYYGEDRGHEGDVFVLSWSGAQGFDPEAAARQIVGKIMERKYQQVQFITVSIGDMVTAPIGKLLWEWDNRQREGWAVPTPPLVDFLSLDSFTSVQVVKPALRPLFLVGAPVAVAIRWILGVFGSIPCIYVDRCWHSLGEITEQFLAIAYGNYGYRDAPIGRECLLATISSDVWYMRKEDTGKNAGWSKIEDLKAVLPKNVKVYYIEGALCNINDPHYAEQLAEVLALNGCYYYEHPLARHPKGEPSREAKEAK